MPRGLSSRNRSHNARLRKVRITEPSVKHHWTDCKPVPASSYSAVARQYAEAVVAGTIAAGKWARLACRRQLEDLDRFKGKGSPYRFNPLLRDRAGKPFRPGDNVCAFVERLPHIKGPLAGQLIRLEPWQVFILTTVFGWVKPNGKRRFRRAYIEVPRGNGKALDIETLIPTPQGFKRMADIEVGDRVFDEHGRVCNVTAVSEVQHGRPCFRVVFSTGETLIADEHHEWLTRAKVDQPISRAIPQDEAA